MASRCMFDYHKHPLDGVLQRHLWPGLRRSLRMIVVSVSSTTSGPIVICEKSLTTILTGAGILVFEVMTMVVYPAM